MRTRARVSAHTRSAVRTLRAAATAGYYSGDGEYEGEGPRGQRWRVSTSRLPIPVIGSIACGDQRLNCSMRGSMEPRIEQFSHWSQHAMEPIAGIGKRLLGMAWLTGSILSMSVLGYSFTLRRRGGPTGGRTESNGSKRSRQRSDSSPHTPPSLRRAVPSLPTIKTRGTAHAELFSVGAIPGPHESWAWRIFLLVSF